MRQGGRWNPPGVPALYSASSLALACLELLVHVRNPANLPPLHYCEIRIPRWIIRRVPLLTPPPTYREAQEAASVLFSRRWAVLQVPSFVMSPSAPNYVLNPLAAQYAKCTWTYPVNLELDPRVINPSLR
jgi:RES domain-containing protein